MTIMHIVVILFFYGAVMTAAFTILWSIKDR